MTTKSNAYSDEYKSILDRCLQHFDGVIGAMEVDGDYGPEWAKQAREFQQEIENFIHWDEIEHP